MIKLYFFNKIFKKRIKKKEIVIDSVRTRGKMFLETINKIVTDGT